MDAVAIRRVLGRYLTEKPYLRFALLVTVAVGLSSWASTFFDHVSATIAAVTAATVIQPTLHHSVREVFWQIVGVVLGVAVALVASLTVGFTPAALAAAVFSVFVFCRVFHLSAESAIGVVIPTILIIAGHAFTAAEVESRMAGVLLGGTVGVALSFLVRPGTPTVRTLHSTEQESLRAAAVVTEMAHAFEVGKVTPVQVRQWSDVLDDVSTRLAELRNDAEDAVKGSRWSPMLSRDEAESVLMQVQIAQDTARAVASMVDNAVLLAAKANDTPVEVEAEVPLPVSEPVASALSTMLTGAAGIIEEQAAVSVSEGHAVKLSEDADPVQQVRQTVEASTERVKQSTQTGPLMLGGALLRDTQTIEALLTAPTCADTDGDSSGGRGAP